MIARRRFLLGVLILAVTASAAGADQREIRGVPSFVPDGDTIHFGQVRVRLFGVDAPERETALGEPARQHLLRLMGRGEVRCLDTGKRSYGRVVAVCGTAQTPDLSAAMVRDGWAGDWAVFSGGRYAALEAQARLRRAGAFAYEAQPCWAKRCSPASMSRAHAGD